MNVIKSLIPKETTPFAKFVRTGEGLLVIAFNVGMLVIPIVTTLPGVQAAKWAGIVDTAAVLSRSGLKAIAAFSKGTGYTPIEPGGTPTELGALPADDMTDKATLDTKPQSGVKPDAGAPVADTPNTPTAPSGGTGTGPAPGARIPGARRKD